MTKIICLDAGHGGKDSGALSFHRKQEKDYNIIIATATKIILNDYNCKVIMTRDNDEFLSLQERCNIANNSKSDIFISIHQNSATNINATGHEIWVYSPNQLSKDLLNSMESLQSRNRGIKENKKITVLKNTKMKACIVECGFISNSNNEKYINDNLNQYALCLAMGIVKHLNLQPKNKKCSTCGK